MPSKTLASGRGFVEMDELEEVVLLIEFKLDYLGYRRIVNGAWVSGLVSTRRYFRGTSAILIT